jgi:hypothetical protein
LHGGRCDATERYVAEGWRSHCVPQSREVLNRAGTLPSRPWDGKCGTARTTALCSVLVPLNRHMVGENFR